LYFERDLPQQKKTTELCGGGDPAIFLCSHGKIFLWDRSGNLKTQGGKGQIRKINKNTRRKEWRKEKEENFYIRGGSYTCVFSIGQEHLRAIALIRPSLGEPTHMGTSPTT
jgi:hypothetical protein